MTLLIEALFIGFFAALGGWFVNFLMLTLKYDRGSLLIRTDDKWFTGWRMYLVLSVPFMSVILEIHAMVTGHEK